MKKSHAEGEVCPLCERKPITHQDTDCERLGHYYCCSRIGNGYVDWVHRRNLIDASYRTRIAFAEEIEKYCYSLEKKIRSKPGAMEKFVTMRWIEDRVTCERYDLAVAKEIILYHSALIDYDLAFHAKNAKKLGEKSALEVSEDIKRSLDRSCETRKLDCKRMSIRHVERMREIRRTVLIDWERSKNSFLAMLETPAQPHATLGFKGQRVGDSGELVLQHDWEPVSHADADCNREDHHTSSNTYTYTDWVHRMNLILASYAMAKGFMKELFDFTDTVNARLKLKNESNSGIMKHFLKMVYMYSMTVWTGYHHELECEVISYRSILVNYDSEFHSKIAEIRDGKTLEEAEQVLKDEFENRKKDCKEMSLAHIGRLKSIRETRLAKLRGEEAELFAEVDKAIEEETTAITSK